MIRLTIAGDVSSKKNSKQIFWNRKTGKPFIKSSESHENWHSRAMSQLLEKRPKFLLPDGNKLIVELIFYSSTARSEDLDNKAGSVMDLLKDARIIPDDNWNVVPKLILEYGGKDKLNPRVEITIYEQPPTAR